MLALNAMGSMDGMKKEADGNTFMTDVKGLHDPQHSQLHPEQNFPKQPGGNQEISQIYGDTTAQSSYFESKLIPSKRLDPKRSSTRSPMSQYRHIATKNTKFEKFVDLIFKSKMETFEIKEEIIKYVQALETSYTDAIRDLKSLIDRERAQQKKINADKVNQAAEKNELETLFVDCIEEVRKEIMKRRLKNEIYNRKKFQQMEKSSEEAKEFEESLLRLAQLAKNRVKITDFTNRDKSNLLDLFVNNEKTLLKIYEALFPHRVANQAVQAQQQMSYQLGDPQLSFQPLIRHEAKSAGSGRQNFTNNQFVQGNVQVTYNGPVIAVHPQLQSMTMQNARLLNSLTHTDVESFQQLQNQNSLPAIQTGFM
jgi:hypothetical protein